MKQIDITKVLSLTKGNKYESACATFDVVDHIFKVDLPRNLKGRKLSIQAMTMLADGKIKYGYEEKPEQPAETVKDQTEVAEDKKESK